MKEYKNVSIIMCLLLAVASFLYSTQKPDKPKNKPLYDTRNLTPSKKEVFSDSVKTGDAYVYYGDHKKAIEQFKQAEQLNPKDKQTLYRLASSQHNAGQYEEAEQTLKKLENSERGSADYWAFRAENISKKPDSLKNIKCAVKYLEKAYSLTSYKDLLPFLKTRAEIYLNEYKYYRQKRQTRESVCSAEKIAKEKLLNALNDLQAVAIKNNDSYYKTIHDDLYNQYLFFPDGKYKSAFEDLPQLDEIEYTQKDIERVKINRPQDNYPDK